jgi:hypothetical protein
VGSDIEISNFKPFDELFIEGFFKSNYVKSLISFIFVQLKFINVKYLLFLLFFLNFYFLQAQGVLVVQPSGTTAKDCELYSLQPSTNLQITTLRANAWTFSGSVGIQRSLFEFDLAQLPIGATIDSVFLSLYAASPEVTQTHSGENACFIKRITSNWNLTNVSWSNQPSTTETNRVKINKSTSEGENFTKINVTNLAKDMVSNFSSNLGFMLSLENEQTLRRMAFASSRHPLESKRPKLTIYYTPKPCTKSLKLKPNSAMGKDAEVFSLQPNSNLDISVLRGNHWTFSGSAGIQRALFEFNLDEIPSNAIIESGALSLFAPDDNISEFHSGTDNAAFISRVIDPWQESTVTWNNQPDFTTQNQVKLSMPTAERQNYVNIDMTKLVADHIKFSNSNGFMLRLADETKVLNRIAFSSSDNLNSLKHPSLDVCYSIPSNVVDPIVENFTIYPNPTSGLLKIQSNSQSTNKDFNVVIYGNDGKQILYQSITSNSESQIDITAIVPGHYLLTIQQDNLPIFSKAIIKL